MEGQEIAASTVTDVLTLPEIPEGQAANVDCYKPIRWQTNGAETARGIILLEPPGC